MSAGSANGGLLPRRDWWPRLSRRGWAFLIVGVSLVAGALLFSRREFLFIAFVLIAVPIVALCYVALRGARVHVTRVFAPGIVAAGGEAVVSLTVRNIGRRASFGARWRDQADDGIQVPDGALLPALGRYQPGQGGGEDTARLEYTLRPRRRGVYDIGPLVLGMVDPFGLAYAERPVGEPHDLIVTPRVSALPDRGRSLSSGTGAVHELLRHTNPNSDELIAREYRPGDPLRRVHWAATAKRDELMVRQEEQRSNPEARIIVDTTLSGASAAERTGVRQRYGRLDAAVELGMEAVASIGTHLLAAGFRLDVVETGPSQLAPGQPGGESGRGGLRGDAPSSFRAPGGDRGLLEGLANLQVPSPGLRATEEQSAGSVLRNSSAHLPALAVLIDIDDRETEELAALRPYCEPAVAFVLNTMRRSAIERLVDAGWHCIELRGPEQLPDAWAEAQRGRVQDVA
ncbi:DUF58 domain-containing protein [Microterricola pindariensis]|uniref:DUF58 domain-containing protein n=1 Tax=Microterricola pindariensis TaxID=478010 RepID=A0ABX5AX84_9MICO|nr:DUF58 domain-containing protein [Microterricola pindariensis]PPL18999.1 hypothetical protein GY24_08035 [Microterricola pindariensis]